MIQSTTLLNYIMVKVYSESQAQNNFGNQINVPARFQD